ncbi:MAG: type II/IV secretion system ATPase subunit, partial [Thermoplasmatales archaeon]
IQEKLIDSIRLRLDEIDSNSAESFLAEQINQMIESHEMKVDDLLKKKFLYYIKRDFLGYGKINPLMRDPNIEDISCDGSEVPIFLYHRVYGSLKSNILFDEEEELSAFVIKLAQKCGKHISLAEPMLDATMPDGSRIQMTLSEAVTTRGSTFTIRKFRSDPITATDLVEYNTMSSEMIAYMWMAVENGINALIAGGTAAGKTSTLNALSLFIPKESKIVSIEETREINLPHPNWIPGVTRSGFGEVIHDKLAGEIDLFELMKAALRQRPEYILVGEIRGREAYVLFQAMATGHTTYSTFHADSPKSVIHRLEGKPIDIPRVMLQSLDIIFIQISAKLGNKHVRRCKQIVEVIDIDPTTKEILMNEVFRWDPIDDKFHYSGKSYVLERIRNQHEYSKEGIMQEIKRRVQVLEWMRKNNIRLFQEVARVISSYAEDPGELMKKITKDEKIEKEDDSKEDVQKAKKLDKITVEERSIDLDKREGNSKISLGKKV